MGSTRKFMEFYFCMDISIGRTTKRHVFRDNVIISAIQSILLIDF